MEMDLGGELRALLGEPVVVALSAPGEKRWGHHQFVNISEYPGNKVLLRFHEAEDAVSAYGTPSRTYLSADEGRTWQPFSGGGLPPTGMSYLLFDGHFQCLTAPKPLDVSRMRMPEPVCRTFSYAHYDWYRLEQCEPAVQQYMRRFDAARWEPASATWKPETVEYDIRKALVWRPVDTPSSGLVARTYFERPPLRVENELLFADYRSNYIEDDGSIPPKWRIACMVSGDNGRTWTRRSTIAVDREGTDSLSEPMLAAGTNGELVCVMRCADHEQKPMRITYSRDRGKTWEESTKLDKLGQFGVYPSLVSLDCGVMVLCYGRPGIHFSFSVDGTGREWSAPFTMLPGDPAATWQHTDGYTSMLALGRNKLLLAYTDFDHLDGAGKQHKAILVRTLTVETKLKRPDGK